MSEPEAPAARRLVVRALLLAVTGAAVVAAVSLVLPGAGRRLAHADPAWLALGLCLEALACGAYALLFHAVFSRSPGELSLRRSTQIALGELAGFALVPTGLGGPALRVWALRRGGMSLRTIAVRSVAHAPIFNAPYAFAAVVLGLGVVLRVGQGHAPLAVALAPAVLVAAVVLVTLALIAARHSRILAGRARWRRAARAGLGVVPDGLREVPGLSRRPAALGSALGYWAGDCAVLFAAFHACGGSPPAGVVVAAYMLGQLGNLLPLPGGVGGVEPVMLGVLTASGVSAELGAAAIVCYRALALGFQGIVGSAAAAALVGDLRGEHAPSTGADEWKNRGPLKPRADTSE